MAVEETYLPIGDGRLLDKRGAHRVGVKNAEEMHRRTLRGFQILGMVAWFEKRGHTVMNGSYVECRQLASECWIYAPQG